ncbi:MAG: hypothetical protein WC795_03290 [Candidatus Paceibacterota bacterium]|jgi:hypothetical protein
MKMLKTFTPWVVVLALIGFGIYKITTAPTVPQDKIVSRDGLHWHAHLTIKINGKEEAIPGEIESVAEMNLHTHETNGIIHAEFAGLVTKDQLHLKNFFSIWGKDFSKDSILGHKTGDEGTVKMFVNGEPNYDFENYIITGQGTYEYGPDKIDDIEIIYE